MTTYFGDSADQIHIVFSPPSCHTRVTSVKLNLFLSFNLKLPSVLISLKLKLTQLENWVTPCSSKTILKLNLTSQLYIFRALISSISSERSSRRLIH